MPKSRSLKSVAEKQAAASYGYGLGDLIDNFTSMGPLGLLSSKLAIPEPYEKSPKPAKTDPEVGTPDARAEGEGFFSTGNTALSGITMGENEEKKRTLLRNLMARLGR